MNDLLVLSLGIGLGFFVQSTIGFAAGIVALPALLLILNLQESVAVMALFLVLFTLILLLKEWKNVDKPTIYELIPGTFIGMFIGIWLLKHGDPIWLKKGLGIVVILFVLYTFIKDKQSKWFAKLGILMGLIGGFFSGLYGVGSPPLVMHIVNKISNPKTIRATIMGVLGFGNVLRIPIMTYNQMITTETLMTTASLVPAFLIGVFGGNFLFSRLNLIWFHRVVRVVLFIVGVTLVFK